MRRGTVGREGTAEAAVWADDVHDATHSREAPALQSGGRGRGAEKAVRA
ncbi:hypothetical protein DESPIGER_2395 [Desulfovibrio piger]|uniref:Uncharacterized protein n=1 Tax=Desulfovibrio piger TaxID=901 RepID=A0A1K1LHP1_9BACT|nr:hypothetical protein DESPIGER_2395 [Desulfovibrio piger]